MAKRKPTKRPVEKSADAVAAASAKAGKGKKFCPHCNESIAARSTVCPKCEKPIPPKENKTTKKRRTKATADHSSNGEAGISIKVLHATALLDAYGDNVANAVAALEMVAELRKQAENGSPF